MRPIEPITELNTDYSSDTATARPWSEGRTLIEEAEIYWLTTVRPGGRPHVTPLIAIWMDDALYFCTGADERKARNLAGNPHCVITTGCNSISEGLDVVVEGDAVQIGDHETLERLVELYATKYGWRFSAGDGVLLNEVGGAALVFVVRPLTAFGFGKGEPFSQTRWRFRDA